mgnify:CR=1 FL=1
MPELNLPTPGVTGGPAWASQLNAAITDINDEITTGRLSDPELTAKYVATTDEAGALIPNKAARIIFNSSGFPVDIVLEDK